LAITKKELWIALMLLVILNAIITFIMLNRRAEPS
jgi:hypothetical protein